MNNISVGVSQCLIGDRVRYDGDHQRNDYITDTLSLFFNLKPFCPEVSIGLGVPRAPIRIIEDDGCYFAKGVHDINLDVTSELAALVIENKTFLEELNGFILMERSPSCGVENVKRHDTQGVFIDRGAQGIFAEKLIREIPFLPIIEAFRLADPLQRENFIARVYALYDFKVSVEEGGVTAPKLLNFYSRYKYQVMSHSVVSYQTLGKLLANLKINLENITQVFKQEFMSTLTGIATRKSHANVLMHLSGYFRGHTSKELKENIDHSIQQFLLGELPLAAPIELMKRERLDTKDTYLINQSYWDPYPEALYLRNYIPPLK